MTDDESAINRDRWLAQMEESVKGRVGDQWRNGRWSDFIKEVVLLLHEKERDDEDTIDAAVGLIKYGIKKKEDLVSVAGTLPDADRFNNRLEPKGVLPAICDILFNKYVPVAPAGFTVETIPEHLVPMQQQQQKQQQKRSIFSHGLPEMGPILESTHFTSNPSVPSDGQNPLVVVAPKYATNKKQRVTATIIESKELLSPADVVPPKKSSPPFVCRQSWLSDVQTEIIWGLQNCDDAAVEMDRNDENLQRIPPMGLARCSRGGKTRALYEIANMMKDYSIINLDPDPDDELVACVYVSFNDATSIEGWEQEDPLQALLRRIAFAALPPDPTKRKSERFRDFSRKEPVWEESSFLDWIKDTPCLLLIDELNNLHKLTDTNSNVAAHFGLFLKREFIGKEYRYMVFSSHLLGTFNFLSDYLDSSEGSSRTVTLQELPIVPSLREATMLKPGLNSVREAMYYGLVPGMIYESSVKGKNIDGKRSSWVQKAIQNHLDGLDDCFHSILKSLINGYMDLNFPAELGTLLDSVQQEVGDPDKIRWVPYHLQFVLRELSAKRFAHARLAEQLSEYCNLMKDAKELSGEGWEGLFVLFLVARCLIRKSDTTIVPDYWFETGGEEVAVVLNRYDASMNENRPLSVCKTWDEMKAGVIPGNESYCLNILYPSHNNFEVYDVIVVFFVGRKKNHVCGYQLKEGKAPRKRKAHPDMDSSLFVQGSPPAGTIKDDGKGWTIPGKEAIDAFFGESGKYWTPESWRKFRNSAIIPGA